MDQEHAKGSTVVHQENGFPEYDCHFCPCSSAFWQGSKVGWGSIVCWPSLVRKRKEWRGKSPETVAVDPIRCRSRGKTPCQCTASLLGDASLQGRSASPLEPNARKISQDRWMGWVGDEGFSIQVRIKPKQNEKWNTKYSTTTKNYSI